MQDAHRPALYPVPGAGLIVVFIHGFLGGPGLYSSFAHAVNEAGYAAQTLLLPGHGSHSFEFARHTSLEWQEEVNTALKLRLTQYEKVVLVGHSLGGLLSINAAASESRVHGLVLWETPLRLRMSRKGIGNNLQVAFLPYRLRSPVAKAYSLANNVRFKTPLHYLLTVPRAMDLFPIMKAAERNLPMIRCPVLLIQSSHDEIVHPCCMGRLQKGLVNAKVSTMELNASWHSYFPQEELGSIQDRLLAFLKSV
jgi:carboxylesterase